MGTVKYAHFSSRTNQWERCGATTAAACPFGANQHMQIRNKDELLYLQEQAKALGIAAIAAKPVVADQTPATKVPLEWDAAFAAELAEALPAPKRTEAGLFMSRFTQMADQLGIDVDFTAYTPQALASQLGKIMEHVYVRRAQAASGADPRVTHVAGDVVAARIKSARKSKDAAARELVIRDLTDTYLFERSYAEAVVTGKDSVHLPDMIMVDKRGPKPLVRVAELKSSGQLDSSNLPENLDKLICGTRNSAVTAWCNRDDLTLERAVLLTAAREATGRGQRYPHKAAWTNKLRERGETHLIAIHCNAEAASFFLDKPVADETYDRDYVNAAVHAQLTRLA